MGAGRDVQALQVHCLFTPHSQAGRPGVPVALGVPGSPPRTLQARRTATPALPPALPSRDTSLKGHSQKSSS